MPDATPVPDTWRETFVQRVEAGDSIAAAARTAGVHRSKPYRERKGDPEFAAAWAAAGVRGKSRAQTGKPRGRSGTVNTQGYITDDEQNFKLAWPWNLKIYDEMRRTEPSVRWMLALAKLPLLAAEWSVEPASQDPEDLEIAAALEHAIFEELDGGWVNFLRQALTMYDFGHSVFERVAELREIEFTYEVEEIVREAGEAGDPADPADREIPTDPLAESEKPDEAEAFATQADVKAAAKAAAAAAAPAAPKVVDPLDGKVKPAPGVVPPALAPHLAGPGDAPPPPKAKPKRRRTTKTVKREAFVISRLAPRLQKTIEKWIPVAGDSARLGMIVTRPNDGLEPAEIPIPADRLVVFTHDQEGDDWRGLSMLRSAYKAYRYKVGLENAEAIGIERSVGLPVVYPPNDASDDELAAMEAAVQDLRQGEQLYIIMPGPKQGTGPEDEEGWLLEDYSVEGDGGKGPDIDKAVTRYDGEMARNVLAEFMRLGHENVGAKATGEVQQDPYYMALEAAVSYVEEVVNAAVARPFTDWNYEASRYPKIRASKLQARNVQVIAEALASLITAGGVTPDPELENFLRALIDAPPRPLELSDEAADPDAAEEAEAGDKQDQPGEGPGPGEAGGDDDADEPESMGRLRLAWARLRSALGRRGDAGETEAWQAFMPRRPLMPGEDAIAFDQVLETLDNATEDVVELADRVLRGQAEANQELAERAVELNKPELLEEVDYDPAPLEEAIVARLEQVYNEGDAQVRAELRRQGGSPTETAALRVPLSASKALETIRVAARAAAEEATVQAKRATKLGALRRIHARQDPASPGPGAAPLASARQALREAAGGLVNRALGLGREQALRELRDSFDHYVYTAILDENNCGPCEDADGLEAAGPEDFDPPTPNPECEGGDRCRCLWYGYLSPAGGQGGGVGIPDE